MAEKKHKFLFKRSSEMGKQPSASTIDYGEIAINFASGTGNAFLSIKKADNTIALFTEKGYNEATYASAEQVVGLDAKLTELKNDVIDNEEVIAAALTTFNMSAGFNENGESTLGVSLTEAIENLQNEWGHQGPQGNNGQTGANGAQGAQGIQGPQGHQGIQGPKGTDGANGSQGPQGRQGIQGPKGTDGTNGTDGANGSQGPQGRQGYQGPQGPKGIDGTNGTNGSQGPQGRQGVQGPKGTDGTNGTNGTNGSQGPQGRQGIQGPKGTDGVNGTNGTNGSQGPQGRQGPKGGDGTNGTNGTNGSQGPAGPNFSCAASITAKRFLVGVSSNGGNINTSSTNSNVFMSGGSLYAASDETLKTVIEEVDGNLEKIKEIPKVIFHWNDDDEKNRVLGTLAQKVEEVYPEIVTKDDDGLRGVAYDRLGVVALAGIDKLYEMVQELQRENKELRKRIEDLEK